MEVEGLEAMVDVIEYREGTDLAETPTLLSGATRYGPLYLRRGVTGNSELFDWFDAIVEDGNEFNKKSMSIVILDDTGAEVIRYNVFEAWPNGWRLRRLSSLGVSPTVEELTIQYELIEIAS
jgi:phage tail-like protein